MIELHPTRCAICHSEGNATELYPANLDLRSFHPALFSARRLPDRIHYRLVKCNSCGLVRSDPVADQKLLAQLYAQSRFDYAGEVANLRRTYGRYLAKLARYGAAKGALLEVGCGNGFFLEEALAQGYAQVCGVEPSVEAVAQASPALRSRIVCDVLRPGLWAPLQFDVICLFQVFDHIPDPGALLEECFLLLKPGGLLLAINHNIEALTARLFRDRCPIIDIEHTYLYSPATMSRIFGAHGFQIKCLGSVANSYSLGYLAQLAPLPSGLKRLGLAWLRRSPVGRLRLTVPLGNLYLVGQKPGENEPPGPP